MSTQKIIFKNESYQVIGACFEVCKEKGNGFLVKVGHYPMIEHERFVNQPLLCVSRIS